MTPQLWIGRTAFPLHALHFCTTRDQTDELVIARSLRLEHRFHGAVELIDMSRQGIRILEDAGWKRYRWSRG